MGFKEKIRIGDSIVISRKRSQRIKPKMRGAPPVKIETNVRVTLRNEVNGKIVEERQSHNIFVNYGREWLARLMAYNTSYVPFINDRIRYMAFGIGGVSQLIPPTTIRSMWAGWSDYATPAQTRDDPSVNGLEYPVVLAASDYYDDVAAPATFPVGQIGVVNFTSVLGYHEVSYSGGPTSVPISEIGLFTSGVLSQATRPVTGTDDLFMVAYNQFDPLSKTEEFVLQTDWEMILS